MNRIEGKRCECVSYEAEIPRQELAPGMLAQ